ncbi:MAG: hypothetical protein Q7T33_00220 [Dehalococcoidia bacterium]|nr:hypothetical protein [Dehalococcoidia bacterium]
MISKMDEYLVHQTEKPLAEVASDHQDWQDRFYFNIHDPSGEFAAITGLGAFPNRKMMQAFVFATFKDQHYAYLNVRPLAGDREVMQTGSLSYSIVEPLKAWKLDLADEANGIRAQLEFRNRCPLHTFSPIHWQNGEKLVADFMHYTQSGRYTGSFTIGDRTFTDLVGIRDRTWGVRAMADVPMWIWISAQFRDYCVSAWLWETPDGEIIHQDGALTRESGEDVPITRIEHELELWPGRKCPRSARYRLTTDSGETLALAAEEIGTIFLGPMTGRWSDSDAKALAAADAASFGFDQHCRFTLGGETGYGIVEYMFTGGVKRYGVPPTKLGG